MTDARHRHYGVFHGLEAPPSGPLALVWGNCQAESVRVLLATAAGLPFTPVRIPPGGRRSGRRRWYADHPQWVVAGLHRHARTLDLLGLAAPTGPARSRP